MNNETNKKVDLENEISNDKESHAEKLKFCILQSSKTMNSRNRLFLFALERQSM